MDVVVPRRTRRKHSEVFKHSLISTCCGQGVSVAGVAFANGLNANQVHRWTCERCTELPSRRKPVCAERTPLAEQGFAHVLVAPAVEMLVKYLEAQLSNARVMLEWPLQAADACGVWLREWLA